MLAKPEKQSPTIIGRTFDVAVDFSLAVKIIKCLEQFTEDDGDVGLVQRSRFHLEI